MISSYPEIVQRIHADFDSASDIIVEEAKSILEAAATKSFAKSDLLAEFGFKRTPEFKDVQKAKVMTDTQRKTLEAVNTLRQKFPFHKAITLDIIQKICKKYSLVYGDNSLFIGFVPKKNLQEIENFKVSYPEVFEKYYRGHIFTGNVVEVSKNEYMKNKDNPGLIYEWGKVQNKLTIVAPLDQMDMTAKQVRNFEIVDMPKDPIVLLPVKENGIQMYLILTKWGDEANDPVLQDPIMN